VSLWVYGNNVSYARDPSTPPVGIEAQFTDADGKPFSVSLYTVRHLEWFLVQRRLTPEHAARLARGGAFTGFVVAGGTVNCTAAEFNFTRNGSAAKQALRLVVRGSDSRILVAGRFFAEHATATVTIELEGSYSPQEALFRGTGSTTMAASGHSITFQAPRTPESDAVPRCDVLVADWTRSSIDVSRIAFGEVDRAGSYFFFSDTLSPPSKRAERWTSPAAVEAAGGTARCLWYHHAGFPATIMTLK
jgi:hypothetical protein